MQEWSLSNQYNDVSPFITNIHRQFHATAEAVLHTVNTTDNVYLHHITILLHATHHHSITCILLYKSIQNNQLQLLQYDQLQTMCCTTYAHRRTALAYTVALSTALNTLQYPPITVGRLTQFSPFTSKASESHALLCPMSCCQPITPAVQPGLQCASPQTVYPPPADSIM